MACGRYGALRLLSLFRLGVLVACVAGVLSSPASAADARRSFSIPGGLPLERALTTFSSQSDRDILFTPALVAGLRGREVTGRMETGAALTELLRGSGLGWREFQGRYLVERAQLATPEITADLEGVVVTALRRPTLDRLTPMSMRALPGEELTRAGAVTFQQASALLPGLTLTNTGTGRNRFSLRGVYGSGEATTALYYDDIPVTGPSGTTADPGGSSPELLLVDVERLELLRGPQGTLYGASAMGGALKVVFNRPDLAKQGGSVSGEVFGNAGQLGGAQTLVINQPLARDRLGVRLAAYRRVEPAYVDNARLGLRDVNGGEVWGARLGLGAQFTPDLQLNVSAVYQDGREEDGGAGARGAQPNLSRNYVRAPYDSRMAMLDGALVWRFSGMRLSATAGAYDWESTRRIDYTATLLAERRSPEGCRRYLATSAVCTADQLDAYSAYVDSRTPGLLHQPIGLRAQVQDLRLQSDAAGFAAWTVGLFREVRSDTIDSQVLVADPATGLPRVEAGFTGRRIVDSRLSQRAAYGEVTLGADRDTSLVLGARRFEYDKRTVGEALVVNVISNTTEANFRTAVGESGWSVKVLASHRFGDQAMGYAQASQGFRPGGINTVPGLPPEIAAYRADSLWNYEAGLKSAWLNGRLAFNAALYRIDWSDMQYAANSSNGAFAFVTNLGRARIQGLEADASFAFNAAWKGGANLSVTDAVLTADQATSEAVGLGSAGDRIPAIPRLAGYAWLEHRRDLTGGMELLLRADGAYVGASHSTFDPAAANDVNMGEYWLWNARAVLRSAAWSLAVYAENLTDVEGISFATTGREPQVFAPRPRRLGMSISYDF